MSALQRRRLQTRVVTNSAIDGKARRLLYRWRYAPRPNFAASMMGIVIFTLRSPASLIPKTNSVYSRLPSLLYAGFFSDAKTGSPRFAVGVKSLSLNQEQLGTLMSVTSAAAEQAPLRIPS